MPSVTVKLPPPPPAPMPDVSGAQVDITGLTIREAIVLRTVLGKMSGKHTSATFYALSGALANHGVPASYAHIARDLLKVDSPSKINFPDDDFDIFGLSRL